MELEGTRAAQTVWAEPRCQPAFAPVCSASESDSAVARSSMSAIAERSPVSPKNTRPS